MVGAGTVAASEAIQACFSRSSSRSRVIGLIRINCVLTGLSLLGLINPAALASAPGLGPSVHGSVTPGATPPKIVSWRRWGHASRKAADQRQFELAARGYEKAIELAEASGDQEAALNLRLCLAETIRLAGHLKECGELLEYLKPRIFGREVGDPLMVARYWKRKASLASDQKDPADELRCYENALDVDRRYVNLAGREYLGSWRTEIVRLAKQQDLSRCVARLREFNKDLHPLATNNQLVKDRAAEACKGMREELEKRLAGGQLEALLPAVLALSDVCPARSESLTLWSSYIDACCRRSKTAVVLPEVARLSTLIDQSIQEQESVQPIQMAINSLDHLYRQCKIAGGKKQELLNKVLLLPGDAPSVVESQLSAYDFLLADYINRKDITDATLVLAEQQDRMLLRAGKIAYGQPSDLPRIDLRKHLLNLAIKGGKPDLAEKFLAKIDPKRLIDTERRGLFARMHARIGLEHEKVGRHEDAVRQFETASTMFRTIPDGAIRQKLMPRMRELAIEAHFGEKYFPVLAKLQPLAREFKEAQKPTPTHAQLETPMRPASSSLSEGHR